MQLTHYDITVIISDPDSPDTKVKVTYNRVPREQAVDSPGIVGKLVDSFEQVLEETKGGS